MSLHEIKVPVAVAAAEVIENALAAAENADWGVFEDRPTASAWLGGYFASKATGDAALRRLRQGLRGVAELGRAARRAMPDADWREAYKAHFKPWRSGRLHWVPVWERVAYVLPAGDVAVWLDPGMAFGTGNHETTRLCCERLVAFAAQPGNSNFENRNSKLGTQNPSLRVIDAGCGSGILAISAAQLGFTKIVGFDNDPAAVAVSRENAALNGVDAEVELFAGDLVTGLHGRRADLVMANILADVLRRFARELVSAVAPGGWLVLSGILATEIADVRRDFATVARGWANESRTLGEWADLKLVRPGR